MNTTYWSSLKLCTYVHTVHSQSVLYIAPLNIPDIQWAPRLQQGLVVLVVLYLPLFLEDQLGLLDLGHPVKIRSEQETSCITRRIMAAITMTDICVSKCTSGPYAYPVWLHICGECYVRVHIQKYTTLYIEVRCLTDNRGVAHRGHIRTCIYVGDQLKTWTILKLLEWF